MKPLPSHFPSMLIKLFHFSQTKQMTTLPKIHSFAGNPIKSKTLKPNHPSSSLSSLQLLKLHLHNDTIKSGEQSQPLGLGLFKFLAFQKGKPLACYERTEGSWKLGWLSLGELRERFGGGMELEEEVFVYLGARVEDKEEKGEGVVYWAVDVESGGGGGGGFEFGFVELRTLMVATDWGKKVEMEELAIAGHARALLEWHNVSRFCGHCGEKTVPADAGRRKQCSNETCKKRIYPRVDPVVIMLVIDKENDRALLSRQARFVPRMWSCLAGFIEPGESLEEAVRRETWEETGIEVGEVVYHSSQPWPVGPSSMPCQLMVGFFAYAKSLHIHVDKDELEDAQWHSREDVKKALAFAEYEKAQKTAAAKVDQMCKGVEKGQNLSSDFNLESGELAPMFIPGPFAIAHHLISSWVNGNESQLKHSGSMSNL